MSVLTNFLSPEFVECNICYDAFDMLMFDQTREVANKQ